MPRKLRSDASPRRPATTAQVILDEEPETTPAPEPSILPSDTEPAAVETSSPVVDRATIKGLPFWRLMETMKEVD